MVNAKEKYVTDDQGNMALRTEKHVIACAYLRSWFIVDFVSSAPIDLFFSLYYHGCSGGARALICIVDARLSLASPRLAHEQRPH